MFPTAINLNEKTRFEVCKLLQQLLSEATDLHQQMKFAHWNVRGLNFIPLHELFDKIAGELSGISDEVAERIAQLAADQTRPLQKLLNRAS